MYVENRALSIFLPDIIRPFPACIVEGGKTPSQVRRPLPPRGRVFKQGLFLVLLWGRTLSDETGPEV